MASMITTVSPADTRLPMAAATATTLPGIGGVQGTGRLLDDAIREPRDPIEVRVAERARHPDITAGREDGESAPDTVDREIDGVGRCVVQGRCNARTVDFGGESVAVEAIPDGERPVGCEPRLLLTL